MRIEMEALDKTWEIVELPRKKRPVGKFVWVGYLLSKNWITGEIQGCDWWLKAIHKHMGWTIRRSGKDEYGTNSTIFSLI